MLSRTAKKYILVASLACAILYLFLHHSQGNGKQIQGGHNVRNYGIYGIVKKMYGIVRNENRCTVRTKMCTDVRNSEKGHITSFRFFQYTQL